MALVCVVDVPPVNWSTFGVILSDYSQSHSPCLEPGGPNVELKYWLFRGDSARLILRCVLKARHQSSDNGTKSGIAALRST